MQSLLSYQVMVILDLPRQRTEPGKIVNSINGVTYVDDLGEALDLN
jgi:hypothetical protein